MEHPFLMFLDHIYDISRLRVNVIWVQEMEPSYASSFSLKSPSKRTRFRYPNRALMERAARLQGIVYISLQSLIKISLNKEIFSFLSKALGKETPLHVPQKRGPYENRRTFPEPYLAYPSGSPVKEPSL